MSTTGTTVATLQGTAKNIETFVRRLRVLYGEALDWEYACGTPILVQLSGTINCQRLWDNILQLDTEDVDVKFTDFGYYPSCKGIYMDPASLNPPV